MVRNNYFIPPATKCLSNIVRGGFMARMDPVVHFEMPAEDRKRMAGFYEKAFGWETKQMGDDMGNYVLATTTESDEVGPKMRGAINGGFYQKTADVAQNTTVVIAVENLAASMEKVVKEGGKLAGEPMDIPGVGKFISFFDTEGNRAGMIQPLARPAAKP